MKTLACLTACLALAGCADENPHSLLIVNANAVQAPQQNLLTCDLSQLAPAFVAAGTLDVLPYEYAPFPAGYLAILRIRNNLLPSMAAGTFGPERNTVFLRRIDVDYEYTSRGRERSDDFASIFSDQTGFQVPLAGSMIPTQEAIVPVDIFTPLYAKALSRKHDRGQHPPGQDPWDKGSQTLDVHLRAIGDASDGEVESNDFVFPLTLCLGCLSVGADPDEPLSCNNFPKGFSSLVGNACFNTPADAFLSCCWQAAPHGTNGQQELICPASRSPAVGASM